MTTRKLFGRIGRLAGITALTLAAGALGCVSTEEASTDDVTDIPHTSVKNQSIGNCWVYATLGWVESMRLTHAGEELNLSESYISYWHWFEQIHGGGAGEQQLAKMTSKGGVNEVSTGGWFSVAVELISRYGMLDEGVFIPAEAEEARSARQKSALDAINKSLKDGALSTAAARSDASVVRAELDKAWGLTPDVSQLLTDVFGASVDHTLYDSPDIPDGSGLRRADALIVGHDGQGKELTLADAIGTPSYSYWGPPSHSGPYAWNEEDYPTSASARRNFQIQIQSAMHRRLPAIMTWYVDFAALENDNTFRTVPASPGRQGGHMTPVYDYEIDNVPGHGTLSAGVTITDPEVLDAALAPEASIKFFRIKNSWGSNLAPDPSQGDALKGYYDLWMSYLDAKIPKEGGGFAWGLSGVVLPPATFFSGGGASDDEEPVGSCAHDLCETGSALDPACDPCAAAIIEEDPFCGENSWDSYCVEAVATVCGQTCN